MATTIIQAHLSGVVGTVELGAGDATMLAIAVSPREISIDDALANAKYGLTHTNAWFGSGLYEYAANHAIYQYVSTLDHTDDRDIALADEVAAGRAVDVVAPLGALRAMTRDQAHDLIGSALDPDRRTDRSVASDRVRLPTRAAPWSRHSASNAPVIPKIRAQRTFRSRSGR